MNRLTAKGQERKMTIASVLVVGAGTMGAGIAQVCAQHGIDVVLCDKHAAALDTALHRIRWSLEKLASRQVLDDTSEAVLARITAGQSMAAGRAAHLAIEAVHEQPELKREIFSQLDRQCVPTALIASNTSSLSISELAAATQRPRQVLGLHFFNPVAMMQAVEVIRGDETSDATLCAGEAFVRQLGKTPIMVNRDIPGFVINRINLPSAVEAMRLVEAGVVAVDAVDTGLKLATGRPMGIFETGDLVGLDVTLGALESMHARTGDIRWKPPKILREKVAAGHLGKKRGRGWYVYDRNGSIADGSGTDP
jgi:3-hydroxybutyryl-CoA dehydrogenase